MRGTLGRFCRFRPKLPLIYSCFEKGCRKNGESLRADNVEVIIGNGSFYVCLSEPQCVSAWWKETAQTRMRIRSFSFLVVESP